MSEKSFKEAPTGGWFHALKKLDPNWKRKEVVRPKRPDPPPRDFSGMMMDFQLAIKQERLDAMAHGLGVTSESLELLDIGFVDGITWAFPMFNSERKIVGIRTRAEDGRKRSIKGTKEGLFIPERRRDGLLIFTEGPTDCAAMLDLGFDCIGRPSCHGCEEWSAQMSRGRRVGIMADNDDSEIGRKGAERLAKAIKKTARELKIIHAPYLKDARKFVQDGGTRESIEFIYRSIEAYR